MRPPDNRGEDTPAAGPAAPGEPPVRWTGERLVVSLSRRGLLAVAAIVVVALLVAVDAGRRFDSSASYQRGVTEGRHSYESQTLSEIERARQRPPATGLIEPLTDAGASVGDNRSSEPAPPATPSGDAPVWVRDNTYVVVQEFLPGHADDAAHVQDFMRQHGVATEIVQRANGSAMLITRQGYNLADPDQKELAEGFRKRIHQLGQQYRREGGRYALEGYFKTLRGESWTDG